MRRSKSHLAGYRQSSSMYGQSGIQPSRNHQLDDVNLVEQQKEYPSWWRCALFTRSIMLEALSSQTQSYMMRDHDLFILVAFSFGHSLLLGTLDERTQHSKERILIHNRFFFNTFLRKGRIRCQDEASTRHPARHLRIACHHY